MLQCENFIQKAPYICGHVNNIIGRAKAAVSNESLSLDSLNKQFQTVAGNSSHQSAGSFAIPATSYVTTFAESWVPSRSLDHRKSTGPNGLSARFIKEAADGIAALLANLLIC